VTLLSWQRAGAAGGPAVVLVHRWAGSGSEWERAGWTDALAHAGRDVLVPDLPGHAASADVVPPRGSTPAAWGADAILADLAHLGVTDAAVAAYDDACPIAGHLAVRAPGTISRMVLVGCDDTVGQPYAAEAAAALRDPAARVWHAEASSLLQRARADRRHDPATLATWLEGLAWPAAPRLGALTTPVLLAVGTEDPHRARAPRLAQLFHDGRLVTVPGDERAALTAPELLRAVVDFVGGV